jgi:penicillin-insensitive murein DD-endopeptidase
MRRTCAEGFFHRRASVTDGHVRRSFTSCLVAAALLIAAPLAAGDRKLPAKFEKAPYTLMSLTVGHPNAGWQLRPVKLKKNRFMRVKAGSEKRIYGHPALIKMLYRNARDIARTVKGSVLLIGDISDADGGPLSGHKSHQSGRDADVGFFAVDEKGKPVKLDRLVAFSGNGRAKDGSGLTFDDHRNWLLVQSWIKDHRAGLSHIFVSRPLRKRLLTFAKKSKRFAKHHDAAAKLLKRPRNAAAHDDHFHLRISCPKKLKAICHDEPR